MNTCQLFVYGSLRSGFRSQAYEYISRFFNFVSDGKVKGKLFDLGSYPGATPTDDDAFIVGELYAVKDQAEFSWAIAQLDDYEGLSVEPGETPLYRRELAEVFTDNNTTTAWIYWYNGDVSEKPLISSGDLLAYLEEKK